MWTNIFPFIDWIKGYNRKALITDALSGLTVALVLIPQSMAYAQLAGLPIYYGLYASFLPPMIGALFGSSRQLATGPVAVVSLMTSVALSRLASAGSEGYIAYAILLALSVGIFQLALGVLRLGLVVNFISHPVINGFTNAAAIIIASSQLSKLFGVTVEEGGHHYETVFRVIKAAMIHIHWPTLLLGALAFVLIYSLRHLWPRAPNVLVAVLITTLLSWATGYEYDTRVPISSLVPLEAQSRIREYNAGIHEITRLEEKSTELSLRLLNVKDGRNPQSLEKIDLEHELARLEFQKRSLEQKAALQRRQLRSFTFGLLEEPQGEPRFRLKDDPPSNIGGDDRDWHLKADRKALDEEALVLRGGGDVVGEVSGGLPGFSMPELNVMAIVRLFPYAVIISLLGFMEAVSIAKAMAAKTGQRLDPNRELIGQGLANIFGAMGRGYPVSGSFSRSALNYQTGAVTGWSSVFTSLTVALVLLFLTPLLYHIPQSVLAAIIMMAVVGLINISGFVHTWRANWYDGVISVITFLCTLAFAPHLDIGILTGVFLSLLVFLYKSMRPRVALLSRFSDGSYHDSGAYGLKMCKHLAVVRFDGHLFFANASYLEDQIAKIRLMMPNLNHIHIEASGIDEMDATGEESLSFIVERLRSAGYGISFSGLKTNALDVMKRTRLYEKIGADNIFFTLETAVQTIHAATHRNANVEKCPLIAYCPVTCEEEPP